MIDLNGISVARLTTAKTSAEQRRLEREVRSGSKVAPLHGMYAEAEEWGQLPAAERARRIVATLADKHPTWTFCLFSAAVVYGLEVGRDDACTVHRQDPNVSRRSKNGTIVTHYRKTEESCLVDGIKVTPPAQTVVDCLCSLCFGRALAIADSAMRVLGMTKEEMSHELALRGSCAGWKVARDAILYANPLAANGGESVARAVMIEQGFMIPQLQVEQHDPLDPSRVFFVDFFWDLGEKGKVAGELDGRDKYVLPDMTNGRDVLDVMRAERLRESRITVGDVRVLRFSFADVMNVGRFTRMLELYGVPRGPARDVGK